MKETKSYCVTSFGDYAEGLGTLRASGGDLGGGGETLVICREFTIHPKDTPTIILEKSAPL